MAQVIWNADIDVYNHDVMPISVASSISRHLLVQDLISFEQVSRNTYKTVSNSKVWVSRFKIMGLWDNAKEPPANLKSIDFTSLDDPLLCFTNIVKAPKIAKYQLIVIYKTLSPYYTDLLINKSYNKLKIFVDFQTPEDQSKILDNLLVYNTIDNAEREIIYEKLISIFEIFENALLRELEIHFDIKDYERTRKFVQILADLKNHQTLIDFFLQKSIYNNEDSDLFNLDTFDPERFFIRDATLDDIASVRQSNEVVLVITNESQPKDTNAHTNDASSIHNDVEAWALPVGIPADIPEPQIEPISDVVNKTLSLKPDVSPGYTLNEEEIEKLVVQISAIFNKESKIIDLVFPQQIPMMYKVCEELISNQLKELLSILFESAKERGLYLTIIPYTYSKLSNDFINMLTPCENIGESYTLLVMELFDMLFESFTIEYMKDELKNFKSDSIVKILEWNKTLLKREAETTEEILKHVKIESKNDFLTSFKKIFTNDKSAEENFNEIQVKAKILSENIKYLNKTLNPELILAVLNMAQISIERLYKFNGFTIHTIQNEIYQSIQDIFTSVLDLIGDEHIKIGFEKAVTYLQRFNPNSPTFTENNAESFSKPIELFFELINMGDLIIQMLDIFYKEELLKRKIVKIENSILNPSLQHKKKLEALIDKYVADGLNIGLEILVNELESIYENHPPVEYLSSSSVVFGPTKTAEMALKILDENIDLLVDCADKSIVEVFQQEIAERFFQIIVKSLKKSTISVNGATSLISDLNLYYDFILSHIKANKRQIVPLFQSLKQLGNIYLISGTDSKAIGKLVSDLSKFNGIFGQEEIYEFVQRRQDWSQIKRHVEKVMYGFGLGDCAIM